MARYFYNFFTDCICSSVDVNSQKAIIRLLDVWNERRVLAPSAIDDIKSVLLGTQKEPSVNTVSSFQ
jgi:hypothetical protein